MAKHCRCAVLTRSTDRCNWTKTRADASGQPEVLMVIGCSSQALVRKDVVETLRCMIARIEASSGHIATLSPLLPLLLLGLFALRVSLKVAKPLGYPPFALMRLSICF